MLYGPLELQQVLLEASSHATGTFFPSLKATAFTEDGAPLFRMDHIAEALGTDLETLKMTLDHSLADAEALAFHEEEDTFKIQ